MKSLFIARLKSRAWFLAVLVVFQWKLNTAAGCSHWKLDRKTSNQFLSILFLPSLSFHLTFSLTRNDIKSYRHCEWRERKKIDTNVVMMVKQNDIHFDSTRKSSCEIHIHFLMLRLGCGHPKLCWKKCTHWKIRENRFFSCSLCVDVKPIAEHSM